jgi:hypothetical protein
MKGKTVLIVLVAVLATAASVFVGTRAVTGAVGGSRETSMTAEAAPGEIETQVSEIAKLAEDLEGARDEDPVESGDRDPLTRYREPVRRQQTRTEPAPPPKPTWPSYTVTAVLVGDADPRAWISYQGNSISVREGDEIAGGCVVLKIEQDGVTFQGEPGTRKYPFSS